MNPYNKHGKVKWWLALLVTFALFPLWILNAPFALIISRFKRHLYLGNKAFDVIWNGTEADLDAFNREVWGTDFK